MLQEFTLFDHRLVAPTPASPPLEDQVCVTNQYLLNIKLSINCCLTH